MVFMQRSRIMIEVYSDTDPDLNDLINAREEVPEEYRDDISLDIQTEHIPYSDDVSYRLVMYYSRPETDTEMNNRIRKEKENLDTASLREYELYKKLHAKFGQQP